MIDTRPQSIAVFPLQTNETEARQRLLSSLKVFSQLPVRLACSAEELRHIGIYLRRECARLGVPIPEWLATFGVNVVYVGWQRRAMAVRRRRRGPQSLAAYLEQLGL